MDDKFAEELYAAIEVSLEGTGTRPSWVMKHITPVIQKYSLEKGELNELIETLENLKVCDKVLDFSIDDWADAQRASNSPQAVKWRLASLYIRDALILAAKLRRSK